MIILGSKGYLRILRTLTMVCWRCRQAAPHRLIQHLTKLTIFFIPTVPVSRKYRLECVGCGAAQDLEKPIAQQILVDGRVTSTVTEPGR